MIGRPSPEKRYRLAIEALPYIIKEIPDCKLTIVSYANPYLVKLAKSLNVSEHIIFTGFQNDVHQFLVNASIYLLLSDYESYCYALLKQKLLD